MKTHMQMETVKLLKFLQKSQELDTFPRTFAWHLRLVHQRLTNSTFFLASEL